MNQELCSLQKLLAISLLAAAMAGCSKHKNKVIEEATLPELNRALMSWGMMSSSPFPKTMNDITNCPTLKGKRLPSLPPGKKLLIDSANRQVVILDE